MKPQDQTILSLGENGSPPGNCFAACVASVLELDIADVPNFVEDPDWPVGFQKWLSDRGFFFLKLDIETHARIMGLGIVHMFGGWCILDGTTPRGNTLHSCVGQGTDIVFDPHPSRAGLAKVLRVGYFVPLDPQLSFSGGAP